MMIEICCSLEQKFDEIVKVGETVEASLKTGKIARVAASSRSSRLLRKREKKLLLSHMIVILPRSF